MFAAILLLLPIVALVKSMPADQSVCTTPDAYGRLSGYAPFPNSCDKYIQCVPSGYGKYILEERQCAFSTFWDNDLVSCVSVDKMVCLDDPCQDPLLQTYKAMGNCRGYWMCENKQSSARCCDVGMTFDVESNSCITPYDFNCTDACFQEVIPVVPEPICLKNAIETEPDKYLQWVSDYFPAVVMDCAKGTYFNNTTCNCEMKTDPLPPTGPVCLPEVYLSFNNFPIKDESGKNNYIRNQNVKVENGSAIFDGLSSKLVIPRFNSLANFKTVVIDIKYSSDHMADATERAIVSNDDGHGYSIMIKEDSNNIIFGCGTTGQPHYDGYTQVPMDAMVTLPQDQYPSAIPSTKNVIYQFDNDRLTCSNGPDTQEAAAPGYLRSVKCGLQIGSAAGVGSFKGTIEEITIYLCSPPTYV